MKVETTNTNLNVATERQSQLITDDIVESLTEISSFFMPFGVVAAPVEYVDDYRKSVALNAHVVLLEITTQQILECRNRFSIRLNGMIVKGFATPMKFSFFLSHNYPGAKVFPERNFLQTFGLSEFLRLEYPDISLVLTDTIFNLHFLKFSEVGDEPLTIFNGGGCLLLGDECN